MIYRWPAAALGQLNRTVEAKEWLEMAISLAPAAFDMYVRKRVPWFRPEDHAHLLTRGTAQGRMERLMAGGTPAAKGSRPDVRLR
jgi:hypothetical protein